VRPAGLRGAQFQAVFARSSYAGIVWNPWGTLPHFLPQQYKANLSRALQVIVDRFFSTRPSKTFQGAYSQRVDQRRHEN
jgi:hypothetical protein